MSNGRTPYRSGAFRAGASAALAVAAALFAAAAPVGHCEGSGGLALIFSGGAHAGGITKTEPLDAVSSASARCGHLGVHTEILVAGQALETGLEYAYFEKELDYEDAGAGIDGERSFRAHGIALPLLYNFRFFKRQDGQARLVAAIGMTGWYFPYVRIEDSGTVSPSDEKNWAVGPCVRIAYYPVSLNGKYFPGLYLQLFRSFSRFYTVDEKDAEAGELALAGFGISLKVKPR